MELSDIETRILIQIYREGGSAMLKDIWRALGIKSKSGMPYVNRLERSGLLVKERVSEKKRILYRVRLTDKGLSMVRQILEAEVPVKRTIFEVAEKIPCFYCPYIESCGEVDEIAPEKCELLNKWILERLKAATA